MKSATAGHAVESGKRTNSRLSAPRFAILPHGATNGFSRPEKPTWANVGARIGLVIVVAIAGQTINGGGNA